MSYQPPLPPGPGPHAFYGQSTQGAPVPYGAHPAYLGMPAPAQQPSGLNPWLAGLIGAGAGALLTVMAMTLLPMLFFGLAMGGGFMDEEGFMGPPTGRVAVEPGGGVSGVALAGALEGNDDFYYEDVTCPETVRVATDVTAICSGDDGFEDLRIVVVFEGTGGQFATADLW